MFKNTSIGKRIYIILFSCVAVMLALIVAFYFAVRFISISSTELSKEQMFNMQEERIKDITLSAAKGIAVLIEGKAREEQLKIISDYSSKSRFDYEDAGYFFTYENTIPRVHPVNPKLHGQDLANVSDSNGVRYVHELDLAAQKGGGFVSYVYPKPDGVIAEKLAYAVYIPGTKFWIGTGVYIDQLDALSAQLQESMLSQALKIEMYLLVAVLFVATLVVFVSVKIINSVTKPIASLTQVSTQVADGDLNISLKEESLDAKSKNEVALMQNALVRMVESLKEKISVSQKAMQDAQENSQKAQQALESAATAEKSANAKTEHMLSVANLLEEVANNLSNASNELIATITECENGASEQASQIAQTSNSMEEMNISVRDVAQNAGNASTVSSTTGKKASECRKIANDAIKSMQEVQNLTTRLMEDMQKLDESSKSIDQVMGVISEIADQTNLLALNAAIEAARAGEAGRGFAVVADEVRKLAEKTMASTSEVAKIIVEIQQSASQSLTQTTASFTAIEKATNLVMQSGETLGEIAEMAKESAEQVHSIATAAEEQSSTTSIINNAMNQVNEIALVTSKSMHDASLSVNELAGQALELSKLTRSLKAGD